jgi:transposase
MRSHFTELSDSQWQFIKVHLANQKPRKLCLRSVLNALFYLTSTGVQWRNLPKCYPAWQSVYYYFSQWQSNGTLAFIMNDLRVNSRVEAGKESSPSLVIIDSQSVKVAPFVQQDVGYDGHKKINGRKRHIVVDTLGYPVAVHVGAANENDGQAGLELLAALDKQHLPRLQCIRADQAYKGTFCESAQYFHWKVDTTQSPPSAHRGFIPQKNRWQIERTFGWLNFFRRLSKDYEKTTTSSAAFIMLALANVMLAKIT